MRRKMVFAFLTITWLALLSVTNVCAQEITDSSGRWTYVLGDGGAVLTGYVEEPSGDLMIPGEMDGNAVTGIGEYAFAECCQLSNVTIPEGVTRIGVGAFYGSELPDVTIPDGVTSIGNLAFYGCYLSSVNIPDSVTSIGDLAFCGCDLSSVTIPGGVINIGVNPFSACEIESITVSEKNPVYEDMDGVLFDKQRKILVSYPIARKSVSYAIPEGTRQIGDLAFSGSLWLQDVTIPQGVTVIGVEAFSYCDSLINAVISKGVTSISSRAFRACRGLTSVIIPEGVTSIGDGAFYCCESLTSVSIPESVTHIGEMAFMYCDITSVTLPTGVTSIGLNAFAYPNSRELSDDDDDGALYGNDKLTMRVMEDSVAEQYAKDNGIAYILLSEFSLPE